MKIQIALRRSASQTVSRLFPAVRRAGLALGMAAGLVLPAAAQDLVQDTLAVRILLDQNGLTGTPVAQVVTIESQRVTQLHLANLKLVKLPTQISALDALKYLVLSGNLLDSLPAEIWNLTSLVELDLGGNLLGHLDPRVSKLSNLLLLGLRGNGLTTLPAEIFTLPQLETLLLAGNDLDTLSGDVANLLFMKYLDLSGNQLKGIPYTMAAMDKLDSLDLSSNILETLPDLITEMKASTKVHLASNRLCNLSSALQAWADGKSPGWLATQVCGAPVRPVAARSSGPYLRAFADGDGLRLDYAGLRAGSGPREILIRDVSGRVVLRLPLDNASSTVAIPKASLGGRGFFLAELRADGRTAAVASILP